MSSILSGLRRFLSIAATAFILCVSASTLCRADGPFVPAPRIPPPGIAVNADGSYTLPDGTFVAADGTTYYPNGTIVLPNGTVVTA